MIRLLLIWIELEEGTDLIVNADQPVKTFLI